MDKYEGNEMDDDFVDDLLGKVVELQMIGFTNQQIMDLLDRTFNEKEIKNV